MARKQDPLSARATLPKFADTVAYVADASIMPVIPRANTNIPALVVGERIARWLLER